MEVYRRSSWLLLLLGLSLLATTLQGVQGEVESDGPSESECRPYIEKALKELETGESPDLKTSDDDDEGNSKEDIPTVEITTDDSSHEEGDGDDDDDDKASTESVENDDAPQDDERADDVEGSDDEVSEKSDEQHEPEDGEKKESDETDEAQSKEDDQEHKESTEQEEEVDESKEEQAASEQQSDEDHKESTEDDKTESVEEKGDSVEDKKSEEDNKESDEKQTDVESHEKDDDESKEKDEGESKEKDEGESKEDKDDGESHEVDATESHEAEGESAEKHEDEESKEKETVDESVEGEDKEDEITENETEEESKEKETEDESKEKEAEDESNEKHDESQEKENESQQKESDEVEPKGDDSEEKGTDNDSVEDEVKRESAEETGAAASEEQADQAESTEDAKDSKEDKSKENDSKEDKSKENDSKEDEKSSKEGVDDSKEDTKSAEEGSQSDVKNGKEDANDDKVSKETTENNSEGSEETTQDSQENESAPEEDLSEDIEIPEDLRPRDHIDQLLKLNEESVKIENIIDRASAITLRELKKLYENAIQPLEVLYKYRDLSNRHFGDSEIFSKPLVLFMGPWSGGKSSIINYLVNNEYNDTALKTGAEPSPAYFNILMHGDEPEVVDGTQLAADFTFSGLQKFGQGLEERLRGLKLPNKLLEKINLVEIPGILEVRKQVSRMFPFNDACQWFIDRADIIFLVYDPSKLDVGPETEAILDQLKGREYQTRILLNKADQVKPEELMRVQSALIWNISPLMSSAQPPIMYTTSLWSRPYELGAPTRLLQAQERALLRDIRSAIDKRIENKISSARRFAVRVRNHAKMVDCYLTTYYNHKSVFGNRKQISDQIIENPQNYHIYEGLSTLTNISRYDLPDPDVYRDFFKLNPLYDFKQLSATCTYFRGCPINKLDVAIAYDLPELVGKHRRLVDTAIVEANLSQTPGS